MTAAVYRGAAVVTLVMLAGPSAFAQGRGGSNWTTAQGDAQRSGWIRADTKVSVASVRSGQLQLLWKAALDSPSKQLVNLTQPLTLQNIISYKGFKALAFVGGAEDRVFAIDYDLNRPFWSRRLPASAATSATAACPAALTTLTRQTPLAPPAAGARGFAGGGGGGGGRGGGVNTFAVASTGLLYALNPQTGDDAAPPARLVPANARAAGAILIDTTLYVATTGGCGGTRDGIYALNVAPGSTGDAVNWTAGGAPIVGSAGPAFGTDGTIYVATGTGGGTSNAIVAVDGKTLAVKSTAGAKTAFTSSPVVFQLNGRDYIAAANSDGRLYVFDSGALDAEAVTSARYSSTAYPAGAVTTWEDSAGVRWLLAATGPVLPSSGLAANGPTPTGAIVAFKVQAESGRATLQPGWASRDLMSPVAPMVMNGVVFALGSGEARPVGNATVTERAKQSRPAVLYALDGATGAELWNSGRTITSFVGGVSPSGSDSQIYVAAHDGTLYAFGVPMLR